MKKKLKATGTAFAALAMLVACHGGGASGVLPASGDSAAFAAPHGATMTQAWGYLRHDPSGTAWANVPVHVYPWVKCAIVQRTKLRCPGALVTTTTNAEGRFAFTLPNGHYLLTIGSDSATDLTYATVHDSIELTGGMQQLHAPDLPQIPCVYPFGSTPKPGCYIKLPAVERSGDYRITALEKGKEAACLSIFNRNRAKIDLPPAVEDEWLTENTRALSANWIFAQSDGSLPYLSVFINSEGGPDGCSAGMLNGPFVKGQPLYPWATSPQTEWFGAHQDNFMLHGFEQGFAAAEFPYDPRYDSDVGGGHTWP